MYHITCWRKGYWLDLGPQGLLVAAVSPSQDYSTIEYAIAYCDADNHFDSAVRRAVKRLKYKGQTYGCIPTNLGRRPLDFEMHDLVTSVLTVNNAWYELV